MHILPKMTEQQIEFAVGHELARSVTLWAANSCLCSHGDTEHVRKTLEDDEDFIEYELALATILGNSYRQKLKEAELRMVRLMIEDAEDEPQTESNLIDVLEEMKPVMAKVITEEQTDSIIAELMLASFAGASVIYSSRASAIASVPSFESVIAGIVSSTAYYTNKHFNDNVVPQIIKAARMAMDKQNPTEPFTFASIKDQIDRRLQSVHHWRVVANVAASRGYHYGFLKAGSLAGYKQYRFDAVLDSRTSEVCKNLNGKVFWLADGLSVLEKVSLAEPYELETLNPWPTKEDVEGRSPDYLVSIGAIIPPLHALCRSTLRLL